MRRKTVVWYGRSQAGYMKFILFLCLISLVLGVIGWRKYFKERDLTQQLNRSLDGMFRYAGWETIE